MELPGTSGVAAPASSASGRRVIVAAGMLCFVLGSVHAFSVFLEPLETAFSVSRASVSLIYSLALITLTLSVLIGPRYFSRLPASRIVLASGLVAATGTLITAFASRSGCRRVGLQRPVRRRQRGGVWLRLADFRESQCRARRHGHGHRDGVLRHRRDDGARRVSVGTGAWRVSHCHAGTDHRPARCIGLRGNDRPWHQRCAWMRRQHKLQAIRSGRETSHCCGQATGRGFSPA